MADADPFVQPLLALYTDDRLTDGDRSVYCVLMSFGDFGSLANCHPSTNAVALRGKRSRPAVVRSLTRLVTAGWVTRTPRKTAIGDSDSTLYAFPLQATLYLRRADPVSEASRPCIPNEPTVVSEASRRVVSEASHYQEPVHREPRTDRNTVATAPAPAEPASLPGFANTSRPATTRKSKRIADPAKPPLAPPLAQSPPTEAETLAIFQDLGCPKALLEQIALRFHLACQNRGWKLGLKTIRQGEWASFCREEWFAKKWIDDKRKTDQRRNGGSTDEEVAALWDGARRLN